MRRTVEDVMTREVVCTHEGTPYKELVRLLASRRVSAVPVVDGGRHVLGVVSEADLLRKQERPTGRLSGCCRSGAGARTRPRPRPPLRRS